jgi:replicative DNA helicase
MIFSIEAEQSVIGGIFIDPRSLDDVLEIINSGDFYRKDHAIIFSAFELFNSSSAVIDVISIADFLNSRGELERVGGVGYLVDIANNTPSSANVKTYSRIIKEKSKLRNLQDALKDSLEFADKTLSSDEATDYAQSRIVQLENKNYEAEIVESNTILKSMIQNLDKRFHEKQAGVLCGLSTGLRDLDARFNGLRNGHLIVLAARPSMGKSALAMQIAQDAAIRQKKNVLIFSLEMPSEELYERMASTQGNIPYSRIRNGDLLEDDWTKLSSAVSKLKDSSIKTVDAPSLHINQMKAYARKANRSAKLGLIVVDHINIARGDGSQREREVATISGGLKALAKELDCPVLALCQLNRTVESNVEKRPHMSHLRESGAIEQDADIVAFLYRDDYYNENTNHKGVVEVITRKFRGGEVGTDYLKNELHVMKMSNLIEGYIPPSNVTPIVKKGFR